MELEIQNQKQLNVQVALRVRPLSNKELNNSEQICLQTTANAVIVTQHSKAFPFDHVFDSNTTQEQIFQTCVSPLVMRCFEGYNSTLLAYGQTGSGKTYTMGTSTHSLDQNPQDRGMLPRVIDFLFQEIESRKAAQEILLQCTYLELYNEQIVDLLSDTALKDRLPPTIREEKDKTITLLNLTPLAVGTPQDMRQLLDRGAAHRTTAETKMNETSSRSHAIFTIYFTLNSKDETDDVEGTLSAKFHFVDLAGSERLKKTQAIGKAMDEGININQSLLVLGNVINTLSERQNRKNTQIHIPYRESKLTRILQDSLGGNANTYMIACVSPAESNMEETLNTLKYATRARKIQNQPTQNRDPHAAQILQLKGQISDLQSTLKHYQKVLQENNLAFEEPAVQTMTSENCVEHKDHIRKLNKQIEVYERQLGQHRNDIALLQKHLSTEKFEKYNLTKERDKAYRQLLEAKKLLQKNNIPFVGDDTDLIGEYQQKLREQEALLMEKDNKLKFMEKENNRLRKDAQRDHHILEQKQSQINSYQKKFEALLSGQDVEFSDNSEEEQAFEEEEQEDIHMDEMMKEYNNVQEELKRKNEELERELRETNEQMKQKEVERQVLRGMLQQAQSDPVKVSELTAKLKAQETKIVEIQQKETLIRQMQKKLKEQEGQNEELKQKLENEKKQKVELIKRIKMDNQRFQKEKSDRYKELLMAKKLKIQQDALVSKLKNDNIRKDVLIRKKEDELLKQKNEKVLTKQSGHNRNGAKLLQFATFESQIDSLFSDLVEGLSAEKMANKEGARLNELQEELQTLEQKRCQLQIKREQIIYDLNQNINLQDILNQVEMELSNLNINRESLNETIEYQIYKLDQLRKQSLKSIEYYQVFLTNSYFKELPSWCTRSFKYIIDNWVKAYQELESTQSQLNELQLANLELQKEHFKTESYSPIQKKKIIKNVAQGELAELKKQLNDVRKKFQLSSNELKSVHIELEYYKKFYSDHINRIQKDKSIGITKNESENNPQIAHSQSYYQARENYRQERQPYRSKELQNLLHHSKTLSIIGSGGKTLKTKSASDKELNQWLSDQLNHSQDMTEQIDVKYDTVKAITGHDNPILSVQCQENQIYSSSFKQMKIWDLETQKQITSLDLNTYVRSLCVWPERNCIAVSHGSMISLYDQNVLTCVGQLKSTIEDIRVMARHNGMLVVGGKGNQQSSLNVWDYRQNSVMFEFEKGMDILSMCQSEQTQEIYWGTFNHNVKKMMLSLQRQSPISQMAPPHYDKVTGVGLIDNWVVSCSFGKGMRMWHQVTGQQGQANSDIHKDAINTMTIDQNLRIMLTGSKDGQIKAIRIQENRFQPLMHLGASNSSITALCTVPSNSMIVSGSYDKVLKIWKPSKQSYEYLRQYAQIVGDFQIEEEK